MGEIYRDATGKSVTLSVTGASVVDVNFLRAGVLTPATPSGLSVPIPYSITCTDGDFDTVWDYMVSGSPYTRVDRNTVVTPYFSKTDLIAYSTIFSAITDQQAVNLERLVRSIINKVTMQDFGRKSGSITSYGTGDSVLLLPEHCEQFIDLAYATNPVVKLDSQYRVVNKGYGIEQVGVDNGDSIRVPAYEEQFGNQVITPYYFIIGKFKDDIEYLVDGVFGYTSVPDDVALAALILAEALSHDETSWQDRYVGSIKAADWSIEFNGGRFGGTGNAKVDMILSKYIQNRISII